MGHTHMRILKGKKMGRCIHETRWPHIGVGVGIGIIERDLNLGIVYAKLGLKLHGVLH
jgi:hypothetical protein